MHAWASLLIFIPVFGTWSRPSSIVPGTADKSCLTTITNYKRQVRHHLLIHPSAKLTRYHSYNHIGTSCLLLMEVVTTQGSLLVLYITTGYRYCTGKARLVSLYHTYGTYSYTDTGGRVSFPRLRLSARTIRRGHQQTNHERASRYLSPFIHTAMRSGAETVRETVRETCRKQARSLPRKRLPAEHHGCTE
ncbi:hypothetical protein BZA05DRAFT_70168 [Tricharina praecox]|uniref:uncharacterized protein n=1 Tax=Tricharina praecox TaxID=43433 RepID=UPI00221E7FDB|nr:uncharacterized protein BZA05DRAFT_70168 [Tricharina praecox]KAI5850147.1 hypothetical protein BZA05DRAFT_70168 [Tricharina praecox]